jgi:hypothetical protein
MSNTDTVDDASIMPTAEQSSSGAIHSLTAPMSAAEISDGDDEDDAASAGVHGRAYSSEIFL